jgi:membrane protein implicated in regulation of membrane protease activity
MIIFIKNTKSLYCSLLKTIKMEEILNWHWWMYAAILLFIIELFTPGFIVACLGIGSVCASLIAYFGFDLDSQLICFAITTLLSLFIIRPMLYNKAGAVDKIKTNDEALIGRQARVTEEINSTTNTGRVSVDGDLWRAKSSNNEIIKENEQVSVTSINSTIVTVKKI